MGVKRKGYRSDSIPWGRAAYVNGRAQTSVELLIVLSVSLVILGVLVSFTLDKIGELQREEAIKTARQSMDALIRAIDRTYVQGPNTIGQVELEWPAGISESQATISGRSIVIRVYGTDVSGTAIPSITGSLSLSPGIQVVRMVAHDTNVEIGTNSFTADVSSVYVPMAQDSNVTTRVTLTNLSPESASVAVSVNWSPTLVGLTRSPSSGTMSAGGTFAIDLLSSAQASALGNYVGQLSVVATYSNRVESLTIPVNVEVFPTSSALLTAVPPSITVSTFGADTNYTSLQICNTSSTPMNTISFTPSSGVPGSWLSSISTISSLGAGSCVDKDVNVTVPSGIAMGSYSGSIAVTDSTGANSVIVPLNVHVQGMGSYFVWDWSTTGSKNNKVSGYTLRNTGSKVVVLDTVKLQKWWACDVNHFALNSMTIDTNTVFSGSSEDGNTIDITNTTIPVSGAFTNNILTFAGSMVDDNEQFQAITTFTDGTSNTSSVYGVGCPADVVPPARVTDLSVFTGSEPGSILLRWTYPGDDNMSGTPTRAILKMSLDDVYGPYFEYGVDVPLTQMGVGGSAGSLLVSDLNVGYTYAFALMFMDEADNNGGVSNQTVGRPWNKYQYSLSDFPAGTFVRSTQTTDFWAGDVNLFRVSNLTTVAGNDRNIVLRIQDDVNSLNSWITHMQFGLTRLNRIRVWYPGNGATGIPSATPNFDANYTQLIATHIDLMDGNLITGGYGYGGTFVVITNPRHLYVDVIQGFTDMNIAGDHAAGNPGGGHGDPVGCIIC